MDFYAVELPQRWTGNSIYYLSFGEIAPFFPGGDPRLKETYSNRQAYLRAKLQPEVQAQVSRILTDYNRSLGAGELSLENARKLGKPGTLVVVTGQQAGLLTGPLLTIYKAMTAVQLARHCEALLGTDVVPVFWIASEDHDFREINHVHLLGEKNRHKTVYLSYPLQGQPPMEWVKTGAACRRFLKESLRHVRQGDYYAEMAALLNDTLASTENICDWFGAILLQLFAQDGLVCLNPMIPELRELQQPVFQQALEKVDMVNALLADNAEALAAHGLTPAVQKKAEHTHLFLLDDGDRLPVLVEGSGFRVGNRYWAREALVKIIEYHPEKISPDVILRPIVQEILLPVLAYVAGPGEVDYWAQLGDIFREFGMAMPPVYPRASLTLVERNVDELLAEYRLEAEQIFGDLGQELEYRLKLRDPVGIQELFAQGREELESIYHRLLNKLPGSLARELEGAGPNSLARTLQNWEWLRKRTWNEHRRQNQDLVNGFQQITRELLPLGRKQETVYNVFSYYPLYGSQLIEELKQGMMQYSSHQFAFIGGRGNGAS